ncbi:MAG: hypothetical protein ACJAX5_002345 [Patiriisocius sp.]|jgi:hypothetical protein
MTNATQGSKMTAGSAGRHLVGQLVGGNWQ